MAGRSYSISLWIWSWCNFFSFPFQVIHKTMWNIAEPIGLLIQKMLGLESTLAMVLFCALETNFRWENKKKRRIFWSILCKFIFSSSTTSARKERDEKKTDSVLKSSLNSATFKSILMCFFFFFVETQSCLVCIVNLPHLKTLNAFRGQINYPL